MPLTQRDLNQFTGTDHWYKVTPFINPRMTYTDGIKYLAEVGGAYWLVEEIALHNRFEPLVKREEFQVWLLTVNEDSSAELRCEDGNDNVVFRKRIPFTDFPLQKVEIWVEGGVIYLPSER